jgi:hypothetical protein
MKSVSLTSKQLEILTLLYRFRFLNTKHIQKFLNHKRPRKTNSWMKDLSEKKLVGRIYSRKFGENTRPAIYFLDTKARKILKESEGVNQRLLSRIYREKGRSKRFIDQNLFLADIYFHLENLMTKTKGELHLYTKTDLAGHSHYLPEPMPDLYFAVKEKSGDVFRYFLEVYSDGTPRYALKHRIHRYFNYYDGNAWEIATKHPFPKIFLVCADRKMQGFLGRFIKNTSDEQFQDDIHFFLTRAGKIKRHGIDKEIWQRVETD